MGTTASSLMSAPSSPQLTAAEVKWSSTILPLEVQEMIITLGPQNDPARVAFLNNCALVCKAWLPTSRSALALYVGKSPSNCISFMNLVDESPGMTLAYAIRAVRMFEGMDNRLLLLPEYFQAFPSISDLTILGHIIGPITPRMTIMPNVRMLALEDIQVKSLDYIPTLLACFPNIYSLRLSLGDDDLNNREFPFDLLGASPAITSVRILDITIGKIQDLQTLGAVVAALPSLQRLTLRLQTLESTLCTSGWLAKSPRDFPSSVYVSVVFIYLCQPTDPGMDIVLDAVHALTVSCFLHDGSIVTLVPWIQKSPHLHMLSLCHSYYNPPAEGMNWKPLVKALEGATHVKEVRILQMRIFETVPRYVRALKALVPRVVVCHQSLEAFESGEEWMCLEVL